MIGYFSFPLFFKNKSFYSSRLALAIFLIDGIYIFFHDLVELKLVLALVNSVLVFGKFHEIMSLSLFFRKLSQQGVVSHLDFFRGSFHFFRHKFRKLCLNFFVSQRFFAVLKRIHLVILGSLFLLLRFLLIGEYILRRIVVFAFFWIFEGFIGFLNLFEAFCIFAFVNIRVVLLSQSPISRLDTQITLISF